MADEIVGGLRGITKELKAVQDQMAGLDSSSQEFVNLSTKAGELKDRMKDIKEAVNSQAGPAIENLSGNFAIAKDQIMNLDIEGFGSSMKRMAGNIKSFSFKDTIEQVKNLGGAFKAMGAALMTNPIFLIVGALAAIGAGIAFLLGKAREAVDEQNAIIEKGVEDRKRLEQVEIARAANNQTRIYEIKRDSAKKDLQATQQEIKNLERLQRIPVGLSEEQEKKLLELKKRSSEQTVAIKVLEIERINALNAKRADLEKQYELVGLSDKQKAYKQLEQSYNDQVKGLKDVGATEEDIAKQGAIYADQKRKLDSQYHAEAVAKGKERTAKAQEDAQYRIALENEIAQATLKKEEFELKILEQNYKTKKKEAQKHGVDLSLVDQWYEAQKLKLKKDKDDQALELQKKNDAILREMRNEALAEEEALSQEIQNIKQGELQTDIQNVRDAYNEKIEAAKKYQQDYVVLEQERDKKVREIEKDYKEKKEKEAKEKEDKEKEANKKKLEDANDLENAKFEIAKQYMNAAQSLTDAMATSGLISAKKAFEVGKTLSIAQTTISTIQGVQNALNAQSTIPEPFGTALKVANAIAIGAAGAASLAKIGSTQFEGGKSGGGNNLVPPIKPSSNTPSGQAPAALNLSALQGNTSVAPLQTYVVAGQVSSAQQAEFKIKNTASILGGG